MARELKCHPSTSDDSLVSSQDRTSSAWFDFCRAMEGKQYGAQETLDAWLWFKYGWSDGSGYHSQPHTSTARYAEKVIETKKARARQPMRFGVYRKLEGRTGVGHLYQFLMLVRHHTTGAHFVVYIPLRIEPEWSGTIRPCILEREAFEKKFEFVGEALP